MFPDLASGIAAAREADVFIGMHGKRRCCSRFPPLL